MCRRLLAQLAAASVRLVQAPAELLALGGIRRMLSVALANRRIAVSDALAMDGIMLPVAVVDVGGVEVAIDIDRAIDVHVDVTAASVPVPVAEQGGGGGHADA